MMHLKFVGRLILLNSILLWTVFEQSQAQNLARYSCIVDRVDIQAWELDSAKQFDEEGIIKLNNDYHPVTICYYGILCLGEYTSSGDKTYLKKAKNQIGYFKNDDLVRLMFNGKGVGLPYTFEYNGLEPPWYSGMAQGLGVSFLLRYASIAEDTSVYSLAKKMMHTMLMPQEAGGCLSRTPENLLWIEEYPNSPKSPQVLNGFLFALFGLVDYCQVFSTDDRALRILQESFAALKTALPFYDQRSWTKYNRRPLYPNRPHYLRLQIFQLKQLYSLSLDPFFLRQACIWSAMLASENLEESKESVHFDAERIAVSGKLEKDRVITGFQDSAIYSSFELNMVNEGLVDRFPWYGFATTQETFVATPKVLEVELDSTFGEIHILYRYHWDEELFAQEKWQAQNGVTGNRATFQLEPGHYQFAIFYENNDFPAEIPLNRFETIDR